MKAALTKEDIKSLRYECRPGILYAVGIFFLGFLTAFLCLDVDPQEGFISNYLSFLLATILSIIVSTLLAFLFAKNYFLDIRNGEKLIMQKLIQKKENSISYEAGSGSLFIGQKMRSSDSYDLKIDDHIYSVDEALYEQASEGQYVNLHIAPLSEHLLRIELLK